MKKRWLSLALVLCMVLTLLPMSAFAADIAASGNCGAQRDNVKWELYSDGRLSISGSGKMKDYDYYNTSPWNSRRNSIKSVTINQGVTSIGNYAFYDCSSLTSITLPDSVTSIGQSAFKGCSSLTSISIPDSVTSIGSNVFWSCSRLTSITIPDGVTSIENGTFWECNKLQNITIPNSVTSIGSNAFSGCYSLSNISIPDSVTSIGMFAFHECSKLTSITIPDSVTSISDYTFYACSRLTTIAIPDNVTSIGDHAFSNCTGLTSIDVGSKNTYYRSENGVLFDYQMKTLICYPCGKQEQLYLVPDNVTSIWRYAFFNCSGLRRISIPDSVTNIGASAFHLCSNLSDVYYSGTEEQWNTIRNEDTDDLRLNVTIHFNSTIEPQSNSLRILVKAFDKDSGAKVNVEGATVSLYYDSEVKDFKTNSNGVAIVTFDGMTEAQINRATISAYKSWETKVEESQNLRYPLQSLAKNSNGVPQRYIYELHSESIDSNGNWCGKRVADIRSTGSAELTLTEPRLLINISACYYETAGTSADEASSNEKAVRDFLSNYSKQLAQSTDGHIMVNKALIGKTRNRLDFYVESMINSDGDRIVLYDTAKLASMADIRIEAGSGESTSVGSNSEPGGYFNNSTYMILPDYISNHFTNLNGFEKFRLNCRQTFYRIQMAWNPSEAGTDWYWNMNNKLYIMAAHETGHYLMCFYDEYQNGAEVHWTSFWNNGFGNNNPRPKNAPKNFGLMDSLSQNSETELSNSKDYNYLSNTGHGTKTYDTRQSYVWDQSCEDMLASLLTKGATHNSSAYLIEWYNGEKQTDFTTTEEVLRDVLAKEGRTCTWDEYSTFTYIPMSPYQASYTKTSGGEKRRAEYPYAALDSEDFISFNGSAVASSAAVDDGAAVLGADSADSETVAVDTSGYFYNALDESIEAYFIPDQACEFTFRESTEAITNGEYRSVNTSLDISTSIPVNVKGELYSVAPVDADIDYTTISWFRLNGSTWEQLQTDLSSEENMNLGARCDYVGKGTYVLMAKPAHAEQLDPITNIHYTNVPDREGVVEITFTDPNFSGEYEDSSGTAYYEIYFSDTPFSNTDDDGVAMQMYYAGEDSYLIDFMDRAFTGYVAVVAVAANGATSEMSELAAITAEEADRDGDGIPDWYCDQYLLWPPTGEEKDIANSDDDDDGLTNLQEYLDGTDPTDPNDPVPVQTNPFTDVPDGKFFTDAVLWAVAHDPQITTGVTDTTFMPNRTCTRAHVVTFLWRANGCPEPQSLTSRFKDVKNTSKYYYKAVLWAAEQGITSGYADGTFRPEDDCTRAQVVTFLWRANGSPNPTSTTNPFKDVSNSAYYAKAVLWALETGVTTGKTPTTFNPDGECTRAHVVTFLYRDMA